MICLADCVSCWFSMVMYLVVHCQTVMSLQLQQLEKVLMVHQPLREMQKLLVWSSTKNLL